jgi:Zn-finger protein
MATVAKKRHFDQSIGQFRYCTNHQGITESAGGKWITSTNGRTRRWICKACLEAKAGE